MSKFSDDAFEYIAPIICIGSIVLMPLGPLFFPRIWILSLAFYFAIFLSTQCNHLLTFHKTAQRIKETIVQHRKRAAFENDYLIHAFVIPNYSEPEVLIKDTIRRIALHKNARTNYAIILAMEASEVNHRSKAENLKEYFKEQFFRFIVTNHPSDLPGEARGKGSNISYAARKGCAELMESGIKKDRILITIADSDSHIPELYVSEVTKAFNRSEDPYYQVYAPPIFFGRNCFNVPAAVRVTDITWSAMIMSNLSGGRGIGFPCSTYTVSCKLADQVGYWDTDADAVGEDMHMFLKCIFKTKGRTRLTPIFVPINLTDVETPAEEGYFANLMARFVQAKRHYNGVADVAYTLRLALGLPTFCVDANSRGRSSSSWLIDKIIIVLKVLETHFIPVTSGWLMFLGVPIMQFILFPPREYGIGPFVDDAANPILYSSFYSHLWDSLKITTILLPFPLFGTLYVYEKLHRFVDIEFLGKTKNETRTWKNYFDYVSMPMAAWMFMTLPSNIASVKRLFKARDQYVVAEKSFMETRV
ncbi:hypothetical protein BDF20DRAFT_819754 [Mycotypha africana]|uniref:uncharacterized protein n=1 Tax=Mycotypha africana TaxID=64632 RepID=UPI002301DCDA|nr:uncharacterized protein BDF20DRAFT_819754 [Mycotypha africana]KAI8979222.1 hypothetical protein BDF20DRAFT_819754 [Mycotypha africana]